MTEEEKKKQREYNKTYYEKRKEEIKTGVKIYKSKNKEKSKLKNRDTYLKRKYGISLTKYNEMFENQVGCCAICGTHQTNIKKYFLQTTTILQDKLESYYVIFVILV